MPAGCKRCIEAGFSPGIIPMVFLALVRLNSRAADQDSVAKLKSDK